MTRLELLQKMSIHLLDHYRTCPKSELCNPTFSLCRTMYYILIKEYGGTTFYRIRRNKTIHLAIPIFFPPKRILDKAIELFSLRFPEEEIDLNDTKKLLCNYQFLDFLHDTYWWAKDNFISRYMYLLRLIKYYKNNLEENINLDDLFKRLTIPA